MQLTITEVDHAPRELSEQVPIMIELVRLLAGDDRPDYWLASAATPIPWLRDNHMDAVTHLVIAARWQGTSVVPGVEHLPIYIAYVTDESLLDDVRFDLKKATYVAIGCASDTTDGVEPRPLTQIMSGRIAPGFGTGKSK